MTMNLPPMPEDLPLRELLHDGLKRLLRRSDISVLMSYRITAGAPEERAAGAAWLAPLIGRRELDEVLVVPGAQAAMLAIATTVTQIGDTILAEKYAYPGIRALAAQLGLVLSGVAMDAGGMLPDALDRACAALRPRLIYCNPNLQNPTTATMSLDRRRALLEVARRHDVMVLEDDAYGLLPETPVPALAQLAPGRVFHVATLAKSVSPGLRTAFLVAPTAELAPRLRAALRATSLMGPGLLTGLAAQWIREGQAAVILAGIRREIGARQAMAAEILGGAPCANPSGPHIWLRLPDHWSSTDFVGYVRRQGLALVPSEVFTVEGEPPRRVRIALGAASGRESLREALIATRAALQHKRPPGYGSIV
jgi:DNA-binding transcriptional MocR family regulator